jgi:C4-dicarboxylate transporter DctQ subunit
MVNRVLDHLEEWLITFLIGAATVIIFAAVIHRYATGFATGGLQDALLKIDLSWAQERRSSCVRLDGQFAPPMAFAPSSASRMINALKPNVRAKFIIFGLLGGALFTGIIIIRRTSYGAVLTIRRSRLVVVYLCSSAPT